MTKACIVAFMKASWLFDEEKRKKTKKMMKMYFLKLLLKNFCEKLFMADLLSNGLHEKVMSIKLYYLKQITYAAC